MSLSTRPRHSEQDAYTCSLPHAPLKQLALQVLLERRPTAVRVDIVANELPKAIEFRVEIVQVVQRDRFERHRQLRAAVLVFAMMAHDHVLQPQQQFPRKLLGGPLLRLFHLLVEQAHRDYHMANELPFVAVAEFAFVG